MVADTLTVADLEIRLKEVLERVRHGEQIAVACDGKVIATINPPFAKPGITWSEFVAKVGDLKMPGDGFADDLESIQAAQGIAEIAKWPDCSTRVASSRTGGGADR